MTSDDKLRELGKALPWERPDDARREALRSSLLLAAEDQLPAPRRRFATTGAAFAAGVLAAAAVAVVVVRRGGDDGPAVAHAQITASPAAEVEHTVTSTARGTDEVIRVHAGTVAIASPGARPHDRVRVVTRDAQVEGAGAYDVTVAHDALTAVAMRSGTATVTVQGHEQPVFLSAGEVWHAEVVTAELVTPTAPEVAHPASSVAMATLPPPTPPTASLPTTNPNMAAQPTNPNVAAQPTNPNVAAQPTNPRGAAQPTNPRGAAQPTTSAPPPTTQGAATAPTTSMHPETTIAHPPTTIAHPPTTSAFQPTTSAPRPTTSAPQPTATSAPRPAMHPSAPQPAVPAWRPTTIAPQPTQPAARPAVTEQAIVRLAPVPPAGTPRRPSAIERHFQAGSSLLRANKLREAALELAAAADASDADPLSLDARYLQATALIGAGQSAEAERALVMFLDHAPRALRRGRAAVMLARLIAARGDLASARAWFASALTDPDPDVAGAAQAGLDHLPR